MADKGIVYISHSSSPPLTGNCSLQNPTGVSLLFSDHTLISVQSGFTKMWETDVKLCSVWEIVTGGKFVEQGDCDVERDVIDDVRFVKVGIR